MTGGIKTAVRLRDNIRCPLIGCKIAVDTGAL